MYRLCGRRESKLPQFNFNWNCLFKLSLAILEYWSKVLLCTLKLIIFKTYPLLKQFYLDKAFCQQHIQIMEEMKVPTGLNEFLKFCGSDPDQNERYILFDIDAVLYMLCFVSESSRKKLVNSKIAELNIQIQDNRNSGIPAVQGTAAYVDNPEMMKDDLLMQEDGATECSK